MRFIKFVLLVLFFLFFMVFFVQNNAQLATPLELKFNMFTLNWQCQPIPFYMVVLIFFVLGALFSTIFFVIDRIRIGSVCGDAKAKASAALLRPPLEDILAHPYLSSADTSADV